MITTARPTCYGSRMSKRRPGGGPGQGGRRGVWGGPRALRQNLCAPADSIERAPANLTFEQAAAIPLAANTALIGLRDVANVQPGQRVLINGASGGVGTFAARSPAPARSSCPAAGVSTGGSLVG